MKITILGNNYFPEDSGIGLYTTELAEYLVQKGIHVDVITAYPYYPKWEIYEQYKKRGYFLLESINNVNINRMRIYVPSKPNFFRRILQMIHFTFLSLFNLKKFKNTDIIIVIVPFTSNIILSFLAKKIYKAKIVIHTQDFEFDAAFQTGILKNKIFENILKKIEQKLYSVSNLNTTISYGMIEKLKKKKSLNNYYFPNWIDSNVINPTRAQNTNYFNSDKFNILYSGNIGKKQDWNIFIDIVKDLAKYNGIHITLIGDGASKNEVLEKTKELKNMTYFEPVIYSELNNILCNADLHVLFQKDLVIDTVMPSKILGMMASEKPSIVTGHKDSEVRYIFEKSKGGFYYMNHQKDEIINKIIELFNNKDTSITTGRNARNFITKNFSKENILNDFIDRIKQL
ncbi:WcaI family glycosyltransferase [Flavobacterium sp. 9AF]|uniref:WcaI family glycosyltransferase n=1 Tax=Flavobacterium sp. 9AF TaxID=2653142 RepID=UPI00135B6E07|nr:WcaI family glycosyltransferase [Flavobacterium sp. 9AF]